MAEDHSLMIVLLALGKALAADPAVSVATQTAARALVQWVEIADQLDSAILVSGGNDD